MKPLERLKQYNTKENLWIYILYFLQKENLHAWKIRSLIEKQFNFKSGKITVYRVLYRLENQELVKSRKEERRRVYQITQKGINELSLAKDFYKEILKKIS